MTGWECPKCGSVWAPSVEKCKECLTTKTTTTTFAPFVVTSTIYCTCGNLSTAGCPVHRYPMTTTYGPNNS